jgi:hypothetical protein
VPRSDRDPGELDLRFRAFHAAHPEVFAELRRLALEAKAAGHRRIGVKALYERLRWSTWIAGPKSGWAMADNSFTSRVRAAARRGPRDTRHAGAAPLQTPSVLDRAEARERGPGTVSQERGYVTAEDFNV